MYRKLLSLILFIVIAPPTLFSQSSGAFDFNSVIPVPRQVQTFPGKITIGQDLQFELSGFGDSLDAAVDLLQLSTRHLNTTGKPTVIKTERISGFSSISIDSAVLHQAYELSITDDVIVIRATSAQGSFYGMMTILQMLELSKDGVFPNAVITDYPDLELRGISDDISRGQVPTQQTLEKIIRFAAKYKMNVYMPYLEDMVELKSFPAFGKGRGALTSSEIAALHKYAAQYFIEIIPAFQTLGHYENALAQKEFIHLAEFPGAASLCVSCDSTYLFLEKALTEVFELFPSKYFNMGADETFDVGLGKSRHLAEKHGIAAVHATHYKKVYDICKKAGKTVMMYGDILLDHPEILSLIPKDIIIVDWHYRAEPYYSSTGFFKKNGFNYIVSPSVWNFTSTFPVTMNANPNTYYITRSGIKNNAKGMFNSNWGDFGAETFKELVYYGYAWSAQCAWNFEKSDLSAFNTNFFNLQYGNEANIFLSAYETFGNTFNQMLWHEVWRHPFIKLREAAWWTPRLFPVNRISWIEGTIPHLQKALKTVKNHTEDAEILLFLCELTNWYAVKSRTQIAYDEKNGVMDNELKKLIEENLLRLPALRESFTSIWDKYYKPENLHLIQAKFDRLISYFQESASLEKIQDNEIPSEWIYAQHTDSTFYCNTTFTTSFQIKGKPKKAMMHLLGDTHAKVYVNDVFAGEVFMKRTLSLVTEHLRYLMTDISPLLKEGNNTITITAKNFNHRLSYPVNPDVGAPAGINFYGIIEDEKGSQELKSGALWKTINQGVTSFVTIRNYPFTVTTPDFRNNRTGWIER